jgi:hypothetical protein
LIRVQTSKTILHIGHISSLGNSRTGNLGHAPSVCVDLPEHRNVMVKAAVIALVHNPRHGSRSSCTVGHL